MTSVCIKHVYMSAKHALRIHVSNGRRIALMRRKWAVLRVPVDSRAVNHDEGNGGPPLCELRASLFRYKEFINISSRKQKTYVRERSGTKQKCRELRYSCLLPLLSQVIVILLALICTYLYSG